MRRLMTSPRLMGLLGALGVAGLVAGVAIISLGTFGQRGYTAVIEHTAGLRVGEDVQIAGVSVGQVKGIELSKEAVEVDFVIDNDIKLGSATRASVKVATLLGTHFLEVLPGGTGELGDSTIPLAQTSVPYNLQDVVEGTTDALVELDEQRLANAMTVVAEVMEQTPEEAQAAIDGVAALTAAASARTDQLQALLQASDRVTGQLLANTDDIFALLEQSSLVLEELTSRRDAIDRLLRDSTQMAAQVTGLLQDSEADMDPMMAGLTTALSDLRENQDQVTAAINGLSLMSKYTANATGNGPWFDVHIPIVLPDNLICLLSFGGC